VSSEEEEDGDEEESDHEDFKLWNLELEESSSDGIASSSSSDRGGEDVNLER
jgi:hypothetical protein